ncbi:hypothetical protein LCGC14_1868890 [marine sediment metagenome]|uniref:Uncharacterized protein n=1 Tax=marine sediment metagenome TaxID=412755 RepID=A0A0F9IJN3_9ZZZZ
MNITKGEWRVKTGRYQSGSSYYLNKIRVAGYEWNSIRSQGESHENNDWIGYIELPSLTNNHICSGSEIEIKDEIERIVSVWFKEALAKAEGK